MSDAELADVPVRPRGARSPLRRYLAIGVPLFVAAGLFYIVFWPRIETSLAINGLASDNPETARDLRQRLRGRTDAGTDEALLDAVADGDRAFRVRLACVDLLLERNRLTALENLARSGDRPTRSVIYTRLARESFFPNEILPDPAYRVEDTIKEWLADSASEGRDRAIALAHQLALPGVMEHIRPLLVRSAAEGSGRRFANQTLIGAAAAVEKFRDCESVERVAALADGDPDVHVRMRVWDVLERLAMRTGEVPPLCPDALPPERIPAILGRMLAAQGAGDLERSLRMRACMLLSRHPEFVSADYRERMQKLLEGGLTAAERSTALQALVAIKDPATGADLPRHAHATAFEVRSAVAQVAGQVEGLAPAPLWIGLLRDETSAFEALRVSHLNLKLAAGRFVGLPPEVERLSATPAEYEQAISDFLQLLFLTGSANGVAREAWAEQWYRWYAGSQGLADAELERAVAARRAFRAAMDKNDVPAARKALEGAPTGTGTGRPYLYEEGWLAARS